MNARAKRATAPIVGVNFSEKQPRFGTTYDKETMQRIFTQVGERNIQADIQSELASCDYLLTMENLGVSLRDFDFDEFVSELPTFDKTDPMSIVAAREDMEIAYQNLPKEIKAKYENNPRKFAASIISGEFVDSVDAWKPPAVEVSSDSDELIAADLLDRIRRLEEQAVARGATGVADAQSPSGGAASENEGGQE